MPIEVKKVLGATVEEIESKKFNIMIGISLGNKYFTKENIKEYIMWALQNTKEKVLVFVADKLNAINYEAKYHYEKKRAMSVALRKGNEMKELINGIINEFSEKDRKKIAVIGWEEIENTEKYQKQKLIFENAFFNDTKFHERIVEIVKEQVNSSIIKLKEGDYEKLALYPLYELPCFVTGLEYKKTLYTCLPYPRMGKIDELEMDLQKGKEFPSISKQLNLKNKVVIAEAYVVS
ncbi:MAG: tRNA-dependent cyclodipeptide synthase [archaeon]|nr:tRNA-dependent cyclodipeptide synthase [archaeon]